MLTKNVFPEFLQYTLGAKIREHGRGALAADTFVAFVVLYGAWAIAADLGLPGITLLDSLRGAVEATLGLLMNAQAADTLASLCSNAIRVLVLLGVGVSAALVFRWLRGPSSRLGRAYAAYRRSAQDPAARLEIVEFLRQAYFSIWTSEIRSITLDWPRAEVDDFLRQVHPQQVRETGVLPKVPPQVQLLMANEQRLCVFTQRQLNPKTLEALAPTLLTGSLMVTILVGIMAAGLERNGVTAPSDPEIGLRPVTLREDPWTRPITKAHTPDWGAINGMLDTDKLALIEAGFEGLPGTKEILSKLSDEEKEMSESQKDTARQFKEVLRNLGDGAVPKDKDLARDFERLRDEGNELARKIKAGEISDDKARELATDAAEGIKKGRQLKKEADKHEQQAKENDAAAAEAEKKRQQAQKEADEAAKAAAAARSEMERQEAERRSMEAEQRAREAEEERRRREAEAERNRIQARETRFNAGAAILKGVIGLSAFALHPAVGIAAVIKLFSGGGFGSGGSGRGGSGEGGGQGASGGSGKDGKDGKDKDGKDGKDKDGTKDGKDKDGAKDGKDGKDKDGAKDGKDSKDGTKDAKDKDGTKNGKDATKDAKDKDGKKDDSKKDAKDKPVADGGKDGKKDHKSSDKDSSIARKDSSKDRSSDKKPQDAKTPTVKIGGVGEGHSFAATLLLPDGKRVEVKAGANGETVGIVDQNLLADSKLTRVYPGAQRPGVLFTDSTSAFKLADAKGNVSDLGLKLDDLGSVASGLNRAQEVVLSLATRSSAPRLLWQESTQGKAGWIFHDRRASTLVWVLDEGPASRMRERKIGADLVPPTVERGSLPADLAAFCAALARITPSLSTDVLELTRQLPILRKGPSGLQIAMALFEGTGDKRKAKLYVFDPDAKDFRPRGLLSLRSYASLLDRSGELHASGEKVLFTRWLDDLVGLPAEQKGWQDTGWSLASVNCELQGDIAAVLTRESGDGLRVRYLPLEGSGKRRFRENLLRTIQEQYSSIRRQEVYGMMPHELEIGSIERAFDSWVGLPDEALRRLFPVWVRNRDEALALFP